MLRVWYLKDRELRTALVDTKEPFTAWNVVNKKKPGCERIFVVIEGGKQEPKYPSDYSLGSGRHERY